MPIDFDTGSYVPKVEGRIKIFQCLAWQSVFNFSMRTVWRESKKRY